METVKILYHFTLKIDGAKSFGFYTNLRSVLYS